jgi:predicted transcriptional regulator of viral defense system
VACWVGNDGARLDALLKRAVAAGEVVRVRRGLFCLATKYLRRPIHAFELAQRVLGPSYLSLESALAHHGWIPEAVYTITSVTLLRSRQFETPIGLFSYTCVPQEPLFAGVRREEMEGGGSFFVATPLKALADYVHVHACHWVGMRPILESLRVEEAELAMLTAESFEVLAGVYHSTRVLRFLNGLRKEMRL